MEKLNTGAKKLGLNLNPSQFVKFHTYYNKLVDCNKWIKLIAMKCYEALELKY